MSPIVLCFLLAIMLFVVLLNPNPFGFSADYFIVLDPIQQGYRQAGADHGQDDPFGAQVESLAEQQGEGKSDDDAVDGGIELQPDLARAIEENMLRGSDQADQGESAHDDLH